MIEKIKVALRPIYVPILVPILRRLYGRWPRLNPRCVPVRGPLTFDDGSVVARTSVAWMHEERYVKAVDDMWSHTEKLGVAHRKDFGGGAWKWHTACWAASHAIRLEGDFVECGVGFGMVSRVGMEYTNFASYEDKKYWLIDRWSIDSVDHLLTDAERAAKQVSSYVEDIEVAKQIFSPYPNARLIQGLIPDILNKVKTKRIAFLHIDLNSAGPEIAAAEFFWDKMVPGAIMLLDDFGYNGFEEQREAFAAFARRKGVEVLYSPIGPGMILKS